MSDKKNTHVAVHAIGYRDEKNEKREIAPKTQFNAADYKFDVSELEARGAVKKIVAKREVVADDAAGAGKSADGKAAK